MATPPIFPLNVGPDVVLGIPITSTTVDLRTVTSVTLTAQRPDQTTKSPWSATLVPADGASSITATAAKVSYAFNTTDLDMKGPWRVSIVLNLSDGGHWWTDPLAAMFLVRDAWGNT